MTRVKWMRLIVRDAADVLHWAGEQQARHLCDFRHRVVQGHEIVTFRMIPDYAIRIGVREIVVVCHIRGGLWRALSRRLRQWRRRLVTRLEAAATASVSEPVSIGPTACAPDPIPFPVRRPVAR
jgi:hypothetical protein